MSVCTHGNIHNLVVDGVAHSLHREYLLAVIGQLNATHTAVEVLNIALGNLVAAVILHIDIVCNLHAAHKIARETRIGLRNLDVELLLDALLGRPYGTTRKRDILYAASIDALDRLRYDALNVYAAIILNRTYGDNYI